MFNPKLSCTLEIGIAELPETGRRGGRRLCYSQSRGAEFRGNFFTDVPKSAGVSDFSSYVVHPNAELYTDLFIRD